MIHKLSAVSFRAYGRIIYYPQKNRKGTKRNLWRVVFKENERLGWRIAYLIVRDKAIKRLEKHPFSYESFEPVRGKSLLFVTRKKDLKTLKCFLLDQPIILNKGIWHGIVTLGWETEIKITENARVSCVYWPLKEKLTTLF